MTFLSALRLLDLRSYPEGLVDSTHLAILREPRNLEAAPRSLAPCLDLHYRCCALLLLVVPTNPTHAGAGPRAAGLILATAQGGLAEHHEAEQQWPWQQQQEPLPRESWVAAWRGLGHC